AEELREADHLRALARGLADAVDRRIDVRGGIRRAAHLHQTDTEPAGRGHGARVPVRVLAVNARDRGRRCCGGLAMLVPGAEASSALVSAITPGSAACRTAPRPLALARRLRLHCPHRRSRPWISPTPPRRKPSAPGYVPGSR